uniref:Uncharacterized protein n=1 Tax=Meleagris gallopavo TaxID=9103 RepID=A0A803Y5T2_MELGA
MCTTALLLGTLVVMLRRRFSNKVEPYVLLCHGLRGPRSWGQGSEGGPGVDGRKASPPLCTLQPSPTCIAH